MLMTSVQSAVHVGPLVPLCLLIAVGCGSSTGKPESPVTISGELGSVNGPPLPNRSAADPVGYDTPFLVQGIRTPPTVAAHDAELADDARVIGVSVGEHHRAYAVSALSTMGSHVVNDLLDESPISVTYCDQTDCARVLTSAERGAPVDLSVGGWVGGQMALQYQNAQYPQSSSRLPLADFPFTVTTWKVWRDQHPGTDLFIGSVPQAGRADEAENAPSVRTQP